MKYAISTWIYGNEPLEKTLTRLQRFGYEGAELTAEVDMDVAQIRSLTNRYDIRVSNLLGNWSWPLRRDLCNPEPQVRTQAVNYAKRAVDLAGELGAFSLGVVPSAVCKPGPLASREDEIRWAADSIAEVAGHASKLGVYLTVETVNRYEAYLVNTVDQAMDLVSRVGSPFVKLLLDFFHLNIEEPDLILAIFRARDFICNIHAADSNRGAVGNGHTDFKSIIQALKQIQYTHYITLEPVPREADLTNISTSFSPAATERTMDLYAEQSIRLLQLYERLTP
jgi:sugar phosphate isomerase/epimerase